MRSKHSSYALPPPAELECELRERAWFPNALMPYAEHPEIYRAERNIRQRLAANHLVYFLSYTTQLEHRIVNRAVETLVHDELSVTLPHEMKVAALQLYTDEGYHALFSHVLAEQVAKAHAMPVGENTPKRIRQMYELLERVAPQLRSLTWFLLGFVSETIITRELQAITRESLVSTVFQMLQEHLEDEARHSRYFCDAFHYLWGRLEPELQEASVSLLVEIILIFAEVDDMWLLASFADAGIDAANADACLAAMHDTAARSERARRVAAATLQALERAGFFRQPANRKRFVEEGLLDG